MQKHNLFLYTSVTTLLFFVVNWYFYKEPLAVEEQPLLVTINNIEDQFLAHGVECENNIVVTNATYQDLVYINKRAYHKIMEDANLVVYSNNLNTKYNYNYDINKYTEIFWIESLHRLDNFKMHKISFGDIENLTKEGIAVLPTDEGYIAIGGKKQEFSFLPKSYSCCVEENFYVLENEHQQLVFSDLGGSICEINLPFNNKIQQKSFDKSVIHNSPYNALFPMYEYHVFNEKTTYKTPQKGGYLPLLRRDQKDNQGNTVYKVDPSHYATAIGPTVHYTLTHLSKNSIEFTNGKITKKYQLLDTPYTFSLKIEGTESNSFLTSGIMEAELISGSYSPMLSGLKKDKKSHNLKLPTTILQYDNISDWCSISNGFFSTIISTDNTNRILGKCLPIPSRISKDHAAYELLLPPSTDYKFFVGPQEQETLAMVKNEIESIQEDQHTGWFGKLFAPFRKMLFVVLNFVHTCTNSWGISIIITTLLMRIVLYPLNSWSFSSNLKLQKIAPKQMEIQKKFKNNKIQMQQEIAMLYKTEGINPFSGCLPLIIQFPFLIGMFELLKSTFVLRGASFIPGWIDDLTTPDTLFTWDNPIIFVGTTFSILPFVLGLCMYLQQKVTAIQNKNIVLTDQQKQMQSIGSIMIIFFIFLFYHMPSGLNIYWIFSNLFGIIQQLVFIRSTRSKSRI